MRVQVKSRLLAYLLSSTVLFTLLWASANGSKQQNQQTNQQQRPRTVGTNQNTANQNTNARPTNQSQTNSAEEVGEGDVVRVETQLVTVPAIVTDKTGRPISTLRQENFVVFEDGKAERLTNFATTEAPFEIALLLDTSGSTREDLGLIRDAANAFINALRPGDRVAVVGFNNAPGNGAPMAVVELLTPGTDDRKTLRRAIDELGTINGQRFYDALGRVVD